MRFLAMWNPFLFVGRNIASEDRVEETLGELYNSRPHVAATLGISIAGLSAGISGDVRSGVLATLIALASLLFRIAMQWRFRHRRRPGDLDQRWFRLFVTGSLLSGFSWGLAGAILMLHSSAATQALIMAVACAIVQGSAGRAYMMPGTALINITLVIGQMGVAAIAGGNLIFAPAFALYFIFLASFVGQMVENRLRQLAAEQTADRLLREITEKNELLRIANEALETKAHEDPLTGLANRRRFDVVLSESLAAMQREGSTLSLMMIDVDHFKAFNDTYGHQAGDECLQMIAGAIKATIAGDDNLVARYGGEEFVVILPGNEAAAAVTIAERINLAVRLTSLAHLPNKPPRQTVSIGLVSCTQSTATSPEAVIAAADAALYEAKKRGRNRVCVHACADTGQQKILPFSAALQT